MGYKLAIFDLDGTLLDTLEDLMDSANFALEKWGLPPRTYNEIRSIVGHGIRNLIDRVVPEGTEKELTDRVFDEFKEHYVVHCEDKTAPYPGVTELLAKLKAAGVKLAVISNKADKAVQELIPSYFGQLVDVSRGEIKGVPRKPAPDGVLKLMEEFGIAPEETVYIGDSDVDVATAVNSGISHIIVTWGFRDRDVLVAAGAKVLADDPEEVYELIIR